MSELRKIVSTYYFGAQRAQVDTEFPWRARLSPLNPHLSQSTDALTPWNACAGDVHVDIGARGEFSHPELSVPPSYERVGLALQFQIWKWVA